MFCIVGLVRVTGSALGPVDFSTPSGELSTVDRFELWTYVGWLVALAWTYLRPRLEHGEVAHRGTVVIVNVAASFLLALIGRPTSSLLIVAFILSSLNAILTDNGIPTMIALAVSTGAHAVALHFHELHDLVTAFASSGLLILGYAVFIRSGLHEWAKQSRLFEQAEWAAEELARTNSQLRENMNWRELNTRSMERIRVAREVHDTVGHTLTTVLFQISAARAVIEDRPDSAAERLDTIESMVRSSLQEIRKEVSNLRDEADQLRGWVNRCRELCKAYGDATGIVITVNIDDDAEAVPDSIGGEVFRIIQESLTNAYRHGRASCIDVSAGVHNGNALYVRVSDDGRGADKPMPGNGLTGMQERVGKLGGRLIWQTLPNKGFDVGVSIPLHREEAS